MMVFSPKSLVSSKEGQTYFRHYFIPNNCNNNKPHALRPGALKFYAALLIIVKLASTSFFFFSYPDQASFASITTANIRNLTNSARIAEGLDPLTENSSLNQAAMAKAKDMVANNYFAHTSPSGTSPWYWFKNAGYIYTFAGENLAMDFIEAEDVVNAWMASPTHRKNIVNSKYEEIGIAVLPGEIDGRNTIICVQFFGASYVPVEEPEAEIPAPTPSEPEPTPEPTPATPPPPPPESQAESYSAKLVSQSAQRINIQAGKALTAWVDFKNTGTVAWNNTGSYFIALNATNPPGRVSPFQHNYWDEQFYRATRLDNENLPVGEIGRFTFALQAPEEPGEYVEEFQLVAEGVTFIPGGTISIPITVTPIPVIESATDTDTNTEPAPAPEEPQEEVTAPIEEEPAEEEEVTNTNQPEQTTSSQIVAEIKPVKNENLVEKIINFTKRFYEVFLTFIIIILLLNILIKVKVQHTPVILQTILVICLTVFLLLSHFHFLERIPEMVKII